MRATVALPMRAARSRLRALAGGAAVPEELHIVLTRVAPAWAATRLVYAVASYAIVVLLTATVVQAPHASVGEVSVVSPADAEHRWLTWDTPNYIRLARDGYAKPVDAAFFPLYPLLIRAGLVLTAGRHATAVALVIANLAALVALAGVGLLAIELGGLTLARRATGVLLAWPFAFFLAAGYGDGIFLALAAGVLLAARKGRWGVAAVMLFLAGLTRVTAIALLIPVAVEFVRQHPRPLAAHWRTSLRLLLPVGALAAAFGLFALVCAARYGDPAAFLAAERAGFGHRVMPPWQSVALVAGQLAGATSGFARVRLLADVLPVIAAAAITVAACRRLPLSYTLYSLALLAVTIGAPVVGMHFHDAWISSGRYLLAAAPCWLALGRWTLRSPALETALTAGGWVLQTVLLAFFLGGGWLV